MNTKPSALVHLGRSKKDVAAQHPGMAATSAGDHDAYGYGLQVNLGDHELGKLGIDEPPAVGSTVHATVKMHVTRATSEKKAGGGSRHDVGLTVTHMQVHPSASEGAHKVTRAPAAKGAKPAVPKGHVAVASHVRRVGKPKPAMPAHRSAFVKPPTVKRV